MNEREIVSTQKPPPILQRTKRRRPFLLLAALLALAAVVVLLFAGWHWQLSGQIKARLSKIRQSSEPVTLKELNNYYTNYPTKQNAASIYAQAFVALEKSRSGNFLEHLKELPTPSEPLPKDLREQMEKAVLENKDALLLLQKATEISTCRYPVDYTPGWLALMKYLRQLQTCSKLEMCAGALAELNGDVDSAIASIKRIQKHAASLDSEPDLISAIIQQDLDAYNCSLLNWILNHRDLPRGKLSNLQELFWNESRTNWVDRAIIGERCFVIAAFGYSISNLLNVVTPDNNSRFDRLGMWLLRMKGVLKQDEIAFLDALESNRWAFDLPFPEKLDWVDQLNSDMLKEAREKHFFVTGAILPGFLKAFEKEAESVARMRLARTALAIEDFRLEHGNLPTNIDELATKYLSKIPGDPFDGENLRFKKLERGYILYSVGPDRTDEGGLKKLKWKPSVPDPRGDIVITVTR